MKMKLQFSNLFALLLEGRFTTQIPTININIGTNTQHSPSLVDFPDSLLMHVTVKYNKYRISFGKEQSFLHLSRTGFNVYKDELWKAYEKGINTVGIRDNNPDNYNDFVKMMNVWYDDIDVNTRKECIRRGII